MTVQVSQIHSPQPGLLQETSAQSSSQSSFQRYLEEEQKKVAFLFFNFGSWFAYPEFNSQTDASANKIKLFSDIELTPSQTYASSTQNPQPKTENQTSTADQTFNQIANYYFAKTTQPVLQDLLQKTGWLVPNLEASPQFYLAQLEGKLLSKLDLQSLVDQIVSQVKMVKEKGKTELTLGLKPDNLGEILLTLVSRSGMVSIEIQAPEETRKLLETQLKELEAALKKARINLADIKVIGSKEVGKNV